MALFLVLIAVGCFVLGGGWYYWIWVNRVTEQEYLEAVQAKREMEELLKHPGWKQVMKHVEAQRVSREMQVMLKPKSDHNAFEQEYLKGEAGMAMMIQKMPVDLAESFEMVIEQYKLENGLKDENADLA